MRRGESGNPFGGDDEAQLDPRGFSATLDKDTLYSSWFQLADTGSCLIHVFRPRRHSLKSAAYATKLTSASCSHWQKPHALAVPDHDNKLTGPDAVKFFERSQLPRPVLAKVWALADSARKGYLDPATFGKVHSCCGICWHASCMNIHAHIMTICCCCSLAGLSYDLHSLF